MSSVASDPKSSLACQLHPTEDFIQIRSRVHVQERRESGVNPADSIRADKDRMEVVNERGRGRDARRSREDLQNRRPPVDRADGIEDVESRDGRIVISKHSEQEPVQVRLEQWGIAWGDEQELPAGRAEPLAKAFNRTRIGSPIPYEHHLRQNRSNPHFHLRIRHRNNHLVREGSHGVRNVDNQRATRELDESFRGPEALRGPSGEDESGNPH